MELGGTPLVEIEPTLGLPFEIPSTTQYTSLLLIEAGSTFNCTGCDVVRFVREGESERP
jgi:hypothetical protein